MLGRAYCKVQLQGARAKEASKRLGATDARCNCKQGASLRRVLAGIGRSASRGADWRVPEAASALLRSARSRGTMPHAIGRR